MCAAATSTKKMACQQWSRPVSAADVIRSLARKWVESFQNKPMLRCNSLQAASIERAKKGQDNTELIHTLLTTVSPTPNEPKILACKFKRDQNLRVMTIMHCAQDDQLYAMVELAAELGFQQHGFFGFLVPIDWIMSRSLNTEHFVPFEYLCALGLADAFSLVLQEIKCEVVAKRKFDSPASSAAKRRKQASDREMELSGVLSRTQQLCDQEDEKALVAREDVERMKEQLAAAQAKLKKAEKERQTAHELLAVVESEIWFGRW